MVCAHTKSECRHAAWCELNEDQAERRYAACVNAYPMNGGAISCGACRRSGTTGCVFECFRMRFEKMKGDKGK